MTIIETLSRHRSLLVVAALALPLSGCASLSKMFGGGRADTFTEPTPQERRSTYLAEHPDLPEAHRAAIEKGAVAQGMTPDDVKASLGRPISMGAIMPETEDGGDEEWIFEEVAYGTKTDFEANGPRESRIFSGVRDTRVRFYRGAIVGVDDIGYQTRAEIEQRCNTGSGQACNRLHALDQRAASQPPAPES